MRGIEQGLKLQIGIGWRRQTFGICHQCPHLRALQPLAQAKRIFDAIKQGLIVAGFAKELMRGADGPQIGIVAGVPG